MALTGRAYALLVLTLLGRLANTSFAATIDFEDLVAGTNYSNASPGSFSSGGVTFDLLRLKLTPSLDSPAGSVVVADGAGLGSGKGLNIRSVLLGINRTALDGLSFLYSDGALRKNIEVNGEFSIFDGELTQLDGQIIGGSLITVVDDVEDAEDNVTAYGTLSIAGPVNSLKIGGQDLVINDITVDVPEPAVACLAAWAVVAAAVTRQRDAAG